MSGDLDEESKVGEGYTRTRNYDVYNGMRQETEGSGTGHYDSSWLWAGGGIGTYGYGVTGGQIDGTNGEGGYRKSEVHYNYKLATDSEGDWQLDSGSGSAKFNSLFGYGYGGSGSYERDIAGGSVGGTVKEGGDVLRKYQFNSTSTVSDDEWSTTGSGGFVSQEVFHSYSYSGSGTYERNVHGVDVTGTVDEVGSGSKEQLHVKNFEIQSGDNGWTFVDGTGHRKAKQEHLWIYAGSGGYDTSSSGTVPDGSWTDKRSASFQENGEIFTSSGTDRQFGLTSGSNWHETHASGSSSEDRVTSYAWESSSTYEMIVGDSSSGSGDSSSDGPLSSASGSIEGETGSSSGSSGYYHRFYDHSTFDVSEDVDSSESTDWETTYVDGVGSSSITRTSSAQNSGSAQMTMHMIEDYQEWSPGYSSTSYDDIHVDQFDEYSYSGSGGGGFSMAGSSSGTGTNDVNGHLHEWGLSTWSDTNYGSGSHTWSNVGDPSSEYDTTVGYDGWYHEGFYSGSPGSMTQGVAKPSADIGASSYIHGNNGSTQSPVRSWWFGPFGPDTPQPAYSEGAGSGGLSDGDGDGDAGGDGGTSVNPAAELSDLVYRPKIRTTVIAPLGTAPPEDAILAYMSDPTFLNGGGLDDGEGIDGGEGESGSVDGASGSSGFDEGGTGDDGNETGGDSSGGGNADLSAEDRKWLSMLQGMLGDVVAQRASLEKELDAARAFHRPGRLLQHPGLPDKIRELEKEIEKQKQNERNLRVMVEAIDGKHERFAYNPSPDDDSAAEGFWDGASSRWGQWFTGAGAEVKETVVDGYNSIVNYDETLEGLKYAFNHPGEAIDAIVTDFTDKLDSHDGHGRLSSKFAMAMAGGGIFKTLTNLSKKSKTIQAVGETASKVKSKAVGKMKEVASKIRGRGKAKAAKEAVEEAKDSAKNIDKVVDTVEDAVPARLNTGDLFELTISTSKGAVSAIAEVIVTEGRIWLKDLTVFSDSGAVLKGLSKEMLTARTQIIEQARKMGFKELRITAKRVETSTSAKLGKEIDIVIDLTK